MADVLGGSTTKQKETLIKADLKIAFAPLHLRGAGGGSSKGQRQNYFAFVRAFSPREGFFGVSQTAKPSQREGDLLNQNFLKLVGHYQNWFAPSPFRFFLHFLFLLARQLQVSHNAISHCMKTQRPTFRSHLNRAVVRTVLERRN
jgi:hypothetical protein